MRDTIDMAREAGFPLAWISDSDGGVIRWKDIKTFEALVRADEREAAQAEHEADKVIIEYHEAAIKRLEAAILAEREACAKVCEELLMWNEDDPGSSAAKAIRARGNT